MVWHATGGEALTSHSVTRADTVTRPNRAWGPDARRAVCSAVRVASRQALSVHVSTTAT